MVDDDISIKLTRKEAIVLFEFLSRFTDTEVLSIVDQSEERVLWDMCALLEKTLIEPFDSKWTSILDDARLVIRDKVEE